ncbi:MAG: hypothetical protein M3Z24_01470, partial [Chloroflexota bacterium]|nr:hypothetical protein [Chloroflexota bacterium]
MHRVNTKDPWCYRIDLNDGVNFCIWILMIDGLRVPPFDHHPEGRGFLQEIGLISKNWQEWFNTVLNRYIAAENTLRTTPLEQAGWADKVIETHDPTTAWNGPSIVGERLAFLWKQYQPIINNWNYLNREELPPRQKPREMRKLWSDLKPFHTQLPTLNIYFVDYPVSVSYLLPPTCVVFGSGKMLDSTTYAHNVVQAAEELV